MRAGLLWERSTVGLAATVLFLLCFSTLSWAQPYREQNAEATIGTVAVRLVGPPDFHRIDGLDRYLDNILLAAQSPAAAILAIYAEPKAWKKFQADGRDETGLDCHAIISTPAPLADSEISQDDFARIKKDLAQDFQAAIGRNRVLDEALAGICDHQLEKAQSRLENFEILAEGPDFISHRLTSLLELKLKGQSASRINHSSTVVSTLLLEGKILNLQLDSNWFDQDALAQIGLRWRESFLKANLRNTEH